MFGGELNDFRRTFMAKLILLSYFGFMVVLLAPQVLAHGDVHEQIDQISAQVHDQPDNPLLLMERGRLHLIDGNPHAAVPDLEKALQMDPENDEALMLHAGALLKSGNAEKALPIVEQILLKQPQHREGLLIRARSLCAVSRFADGVEAYDKVLNNIPRPGPDLFIEQARTAAQSDPHGYRDAVNYLEKGMDILGPLPSLQIEALNYEASNHDVDAAVKRIDELLALGGRQEEWYVRRAEILESSGREFEAHVDYKSAIQMMLDRPDRMKRTEAFQTLFTRAMRGLRRTEAAVKP